MQTPSQRRRYEQLRKGKFCTRCGSQDTDGFALCKRHRDYDKEAHEKRRARHLKKGLCAECDNRINYERSIRFCTAHLDALAAHARAVRERQRRP